MRFPLSTANDGWGRSGANPPTAIYWPVLSPVRGLSILGSRLGGQASPLCSQVVHEAKTIRQWISPGDGSPAASHPHVDWAGIRGDAR